MPKLSHRVCLTLALNGNNCSTSDTTQFTRQIAKNGAEFIDITTCNINIKDYDIKCVYNTNGRMKSKNSAESLIYFNSDIT